MVSPFLIRARKTWHKIFIIWRKVTSLREANLIFLIIAVSLALSLLSYHFLTVDNLLSTAIGMSADGIIAVGMTVALVCGGFDLSVGSVMGLSGVTAGVLYLSGVDIWLACVAGLLAGMLCGLLNGFFIGKIGLNPFIATLGIAGIARGAAYVETQGSPVSITGVSASFAFIGEGKVLGIPFAVILLVIIAVFGDFMMRRSEPLRKVFYTGSNEKAAILSGINTARVKTGVYLLTATLASLAGILSLARFTVATPTAGMGSEMRSISAAVIGGASLSGGEGTVFGAVLGVILLNLINNGLILINVPVFWQELINGVILIFAVTLDHLSHQNEVNKLKAVK
ncbi:MAG: ABC transporter permease [Bacillota bacterium]